VAEPADKNLTVVKFRSVPLTHNKYNNKTIFYPNGVEMPLVMTSSVSGYVTSLGFDSDLLFRVSSRWQVSWRTIRVPVGSAVMISFPKIHSLYYQGLALEISSESGNYTETVDRDSTLLAARVYQEAVLAVTLKTHRKDSLNPFLFRIKMLFSFHSEPEIPETVTVSFTDSIKVKVKVKSS
jgi:hypothetical protein